MATADSAGSTGSTVDLHTHTTMSDGLLAPAELIHAASRRGLSVLAITDHDTTAALAPATEAAAPIGLEIVPGVELSTDAEGHEAHILGYFFEPDRRQLQLALQWFAEARRARVARIVDRLAAIDLPVAVSRVMELAQPGTVGRPHVARAMIERGYVSTISEAFQRYLGAGRPGYVPRDKVAAIGAIALVRESGGVAVLAHPLSTNDVEGTLRQLVPAGLDGLEVYYGEYDEVQRQQLAHIADRWQLIPTGGSDFHGEGRPGRELGGAPVPVSSVERLRAAARARRA